MIKYITYKKQKLPIRVSYFVMKKIKEVHGKEIDELTDKDISIYEDFLYYALISGHRAEGKTMTLEQKDMEDVLDETFFEFIKLIQEFFQQGMVEGSQAMKPQMKRKK